jgi:hypothetical protein
MNSETKGARYLVVASVERNVRRGWNILDRFSTQGQAEWGVQKWALEMPEAHPHVQIAPQKPRKHVPHKEVGW